MRPLGLLIPVLLFASLLSSASPAPAENPSIRLFEAPANPYGCPRPAMGETNVPLRTSFFLELAVVNGAKDDKVDLDSLSVELQRATGKTVRVIKPGQKIARGWRGGVSRTVFGGGWGVNPTLSAWFDSGKALDPLTTYTLRIAARSEKGVEVPSAAPQWRFFTEEAPRTRAVSCAVDLAAPRVAWHGGFFSGICQPGVEPGLRPSYEMMLAARKEAPRAWSLQRVGGITGTERQPAWLWSRSCTNFERDRETRRIAAMETTPRGVLLRVEDFFGHAQYGIPSNRPLTEDYKPGYEVLISDGVIATRTLVLAADDKARTVLVKEFAPDASNWKIAYAGNLPEKEDPYAPGLFAPGGCYLQRFSPVGTAQYYWGRVDNEYDLVHRHLGRRLVVNFLDVPGDLVRNGTGGFVPKDWAQYHEVVRAATAHLIERYGKACLDWYWSVFNEPDLTGPEDRSEEGWMGLQAFYDYTVDGVLRAFEDAGLDSDRAIVGGWELGAIWNGLRVDEVLAHCSPVATGKGALPKNAAYAHPKLAGKRSRRVEQLCAAHDGKGSPLDFISVHRYDSSEGTAERLTRAKEIALRVDPAYYKDLIITSYECAPGWSLGPDPPAGDSFRGNGYFSTWCADVTWRLLERASRDPRFAYGEQTITRWPFPIGNFTGLNEVVQPLGVAPDRSVSIRMPIFHFLTLLNSMDNNYWLLPAQEVGGDRIAGFVSRTDKDLRVVLYAQNTLDLQSRSDASFDVAVDLKGVEWPRVKTQSYRFDKKRNTVYPLAVRVSERLSAQPKVKPANPKLLKKLTDRLEQGNTEDQLRTLKRLGKMGQPAIAAFPAIMKLSKSEGADPEVRKGAGQALSAIYTGRRPRFVTKREAREAERLSVLRATDEQTDLPTASGTLRLRLPVAANGVNFTIVSPD